MDLSPLSRTSDDGAEAQRGVVGDGAILIGEESYAQIIEDIKALLPSHWREIALYQGSIPLDPDFDMYKKIYEMGMLTIISVRTLEKNKLVGYALYFTRPHMHYRQNKWAVSDIFWLHPDYRQLGHGRALFRKVEDVLREAGVDVMHTTLKVDHPEAAFVLESLGHTKIELGYSKRL